MEPLSFSQFFSGEAQPSLHFHVFYSLQDERIACLKITSFVTDATLFTWTTDDCPFDDCAGIRFGPLEALLRTSKLPVRVISSMGKQSTGKSFFLNHFSGSLFAISGRRCTDGAWRVALSPSFALPVLPSSNSQRPPWLSSDKINGCPLYRL